MKGAASHLVHPARSALTPLLLARSEERLLRGFGATGCASVYRYQREPDDTLLACLCITTGREEHYRCKTLEQSHDLVAYPALTRPARIGLRDEEALESSLAFVPLPASRCYALELLVAVRAWRAANAHDGDAVAAVLQARAAARARFPRAC